jgi:ABC-type Fe3+-siderophore transport system permease subunit
MRWLTKSRMIGVAIGMGTFAITQWVLMAKWTTWFHGQDEPWFLNTTSASQFTLTCFFVVSLIARACHRSGGSIWVGAVIAMIVVMCVPPGPGILWPIAMVLGGGMLAAAILIGNMLGLGVRYLVVKITSERSG